MKKLTLILLSFVSIGLLNSQIDVELISDTSFEGDLTSSLEYFTTDFWVFNEGDEAVNLKWTMSPGENCNDWEWAVFDNNFCHPPGQLSNIDEDGTGFAYTLEAGEGHELSIWTYPYEIGGCCPLEILFSTVENPEVVIASIDLVLAVNEPDCEGVFISVDEKPIFDLRLYPNPTNDSFQIQSDQPITRALVYDLYGALILDFNTLPITKIDLSYVSNGMYLVELMIGKEVVSTKRILKE